MSEHARHTNHIIADLLRIVVDRQWQENALYMGAGDYADGCPDCKACKELSVSQERDPKADERRFERNEHREDCPAAALIEEARAYLRVENQLAEDRKDDAITEVP